MKLNINEMRQLEFGVFETTMTQITNTKTMLNGNKAEHREKWEKSV